MMRVLSVAKMNLSPTFIAAFASWRWTTPTKQDCVGFAFRPLRLPKGCLSLKNPIQIVSIEGQKDVLMVQMTLKRAQRRREVVENASESVQNVSIFPAGAARPSR